MSNCIRKSFESTLDNRRGRKFIDHEDHGNRRTIKYHSSVDAVIVGHSNREKTTIRKLPFPPEMVKSSTYCQDANEKLQWIEMLGMMRCAAMASSRINTHSQERGKTNYEFAKLLMVLDWRV